jgi:hypothetical protein
LSRTSSRCIRLVIVATLAGCGSGATAPVAELTAPALAQLDSLYLDEFRARERYDKVLTVFGAVAPFVDLARQQPERLMRLGAIYARYPQASLPDPNVGLHYIEHFQDVAGACDIAGKFARRTTERYTYTLRMGVPTDVGAALSANLNDTRTADLPRTLACR